MNSLQWTSATLQISSATLDIEDVSRIINVSPTRFFRIGELCSKRNPNSSVRERNVWLLESELDDEAAIESHIEHFLSVLEENIIGIKRLAQECELNVVCAFGSENGQGGFSLDHKFLQELSKYPIGLIVDLFPPRRK